VGERFDAVTLPAVALIEGIDELEKAIFGRIDVTGECEDVSLDDSDLTLPGKVVVK